MKIIVCLKQVPDTEAIIRPDINNPSKIVEKDIKFILNPYDEFAIEEAIRIKEKLGSGDITLITIGPNRADEALRDGIAMGASSAIRIWDDNLSDIDPFTTATILSKLISQMEYDLIICGKQAIDDDYIQVPALIAELLDIAQIQFISKEEVDENSMTITCTQEIDGGRRVVKAKLPAVITTPKGLNQPRYPSLRGKMQARKMEIPVKTLQELGLTDDILNMLKIKTERLSPPPSRKAGRILHGEPEEVVKELIVFLREEEKVL
ncbi:MAG: electron transfer flavoprotein subunit beta/FixA family protein [bacterium]